MSKKERIEDLGRLAVMLNKITDNAIFDLYDIRAKDFVYWFQDQKKELQSDMLHQMAYRIEEVNEDLCKCISIARGDEE